MSFLTTRTLKQLAMDEHHRFPETLSLVTINTYMDDIVSGEQNMEKALILQDQLVQLFQAAGMKLYKWISNSKILLNNVPREDRNYNFDSYEIIKTLAPYLESKFRLFLIYSFSFNCNLLHNYKRKNNFT